MVVVPCGWCDLSQYEIIPSLQKEILLRQGIQIPKIIQHIVALLCGMSQRHKKIIEYLLRLKQNLGAERIQREFVMKK